MPDKNKGEKRARKKSIPVKSKGPVLKKCLEPKSEDGIAKSKKLTEKLKTTRTGSCKPSSSRTNALDEPRICGNGKPMPSLADLEKMFNDSDTDEPETTTTINHPNVSTPNTPEKNKIVLTEEKLMSPGTIKKLADKMLDLITNLPESILIDDDGPPAPIIRPKKRKKTEEPYIVGCKDRPQVPQKPSVNFCKGDDYGIEKNNENGDDECPKKRAKRTKAVNVSKSIFNAKSDEIASWLKNCDRAEQSDGSSDSNKTVEYMSRPYSFSPLPSTSKDSQIIAQNDIRFNESLITETVTESNAQDSGIVDSTINDTIVIDDDSSETYLPKIETDTSDCEIIVIITDENPENDDIIIADEYTYKSIGNTDLSPDILEIIDVDDVIAESTAIVEKYSRVKKLNTITHVDSSCILDLDNTSNDDGAQSSMKPHTSAEITTNINSQTTSNVDVSRVEEIVKRFFEKESIEIDKQSKNPESILNMVKSKFGKTCHELFTTFTNWLVTHDPLSGNNRLNNEPPNNNPGTSRQSQTVRQTTSGPLEINNEYIRTINLTDNSSYYGGYIQNTFNRNHIENSATEMLKMLCQEARNSVHQTQNTCPSENCRVMCDAPPQNSGHINTQQYPINRSSVINFADYTQRMRKTNRKKKNSKSRNSIPQPQALLPPRSPLPPAPPQLPPPPPKLLPPQSQLHPPPPLTQALPPQVVKNFGDCPICMDSLGSTPVASTTCGHIFCMACIKASMRSNGKRCPNCRKSLKGPGYHQLFL